MKYKELSKIEFETFLHEIRHGRLVERNDCLNESALLNVPTHQTYFSNNFLSYIINPWSI